MPASTAFLTALKPLTTRAVNIRVLSSLNNYGEAQYSGSATEYAAYIQKVTVENADLERNERVIEYKAYIPSSALSLGMDDEIEFPDGSIRPIIEIDERWDEQGKQFVVVSLGDG
jgi:hypothetical protein